MSRITIQINNLSDVDGFPVDNWTDYYSCWCEPLDLYGEELYASQSIRYNNVLKFKVRYCNKIRAMRTADKSLYRVIFEDKPYEVYQVDFKNNSKDFVYIKAKLIV